MFVLEKFKNGEKTVTVIYRKSDVKLLLKVVLRTPELASIIRSSPKYAVLSMFYKE